MKSLNISKAEAACAALASLLQEKICELKKTVYHGTGSWVDRAEQALGTYLDSK